MSLNQAVEAAASAVVAISMTTDDFINKFKPVKNHIDDNASFDGCMLETYGDELEYVRNKLQSDPLKIWTVLDCDGESVIANGYHYVNRVGYLITEIDADSPMIEAFEPTTNIKLKFIFNYTKKEQYSNDELLNDLESAMDIMVDSCIRSTTEEFEHPYYVINHEVSIIEIKSEQFDSGDFATFKLDLTIKFDEDDTPTTEALIAIVKKFVESDSFSSMHCAGQSLTSFTVESAANVIVSDESNVEEIPAYTGNKCPHCGSLEITVSTTEVDGMSAWQEVSCDDCHSTWQDIYNLAGYDNLKTPA